MNLAENMLFLTKLRLENFCNYEHHTFDFRKSNLEPYKYICFFGPNGCGKTTLLEAISLLTMNSSGRDAENVTRSLRKYVRNKNYDPSYEGISGYEYTSTGFAKTYEDKLANMVIEGTYEMNGQSYIVRLTQNGFDRNDLSPGDNGPGPWKDDHLFYRQRVAHLITSDSDLSLSKFQVQQEQIKKLEHITSTIMRYPTECINPSGVSPLDLTYCTDLVIHKNDHKIHYKRMSAGEKKIVKSFSQLLNLVYDLEHPDPGEPVLSEYPRLLLIDNIEMHIYYDRHEAMVDCIKRFFPVQQIFTTTHSGILIQKFLNKQNDSENELMINLEEING